MGGNRVAESPSRTGYAISTAATSLLTDRRWWAKSRDELLALPKEFVLSSCSGIEISATPAEVRAAGPEGGQGREHRNRGRLEDEGEQNDPAGEPPTV
jgi:hypothetical protein